jgi:hypothetical protein
MEFVCLFVYLYTLERFELMLQRPVMMLGVASNGRERDKSSEGTEENG